MEAVRVVVRVRPLLEKESVDRCSSCARVEDGKQVILGDERAFTFDTVLDAHCGADVVYRECCSHLLPPFFEGYNCTVFAYGQTGAGKTHTMNELIEYLLNDMYIRMEQLPPSKTPTLRISCMEIHNEVVRDLLDAGESKAITIREGVDGNVIVSGLEEHHVSSRGELYSYIQKGTASRTVASTLMNDASSRSHSIITISLEQRTSSELLSTGDTMVSKFRLVDLAGSERVKRTGASGARLKESININSGLLTLGNVIAALCEQQEQPNKKVHIPYRECKLTRVLQDSLGGNSVTVMVACISPADNSLEESLNTLKYANRAKNIMNKPIQNRDPKALAVENLQAQLAQAITLLQQNNIPFDLTGNVVVAALPSNSPSAIQHAVATADVEREKKNLVTIIETCFELVEEFERQIGCEEDGNGLPERDVDQLVPRLHRVLRQNYESTAVAISLRKEVQKLRKHTKLLEDDLFRAEFSAMCAHNDRQKLLAQLTPPTDGEGDAGSQENKEEIKMMIKKLTEEKEALWKEKAEIESRSRHLTAEVSQFEKTPAEQDEMFMQMEQEIVKREEIIQSMLAREQETRRTQEQYAKMIEKVQEQRDRAKAELARALQALESRGLGKDVKEKEVKRIQSAYESKLRSAEHTLTEMRRKQRESESLLRQHQMERERVKRLQNELNSLKENYEQSKERARLEAAKVDKLRATSASQLHHLQKQLRELEAEKMRLAAALAKKEEDILKAKSSPTAVAQHTTGSSPPLGSRELSAFARQGSITSGTMWRINTRYPPPASTTATPSSIHGVGGYAPITTALDSSQHGGGHTQGGGADSESNDDAQHLPGSGHPSHPRRPILLSDSHSIEAYERISELRARIDAEQQKLHRITSEWDDAVRFRDDMQKALSHRKSTDESRLHRSLSGWALKIAKLEKEIAQLSARNDPSLAERITRLKSEKKTAELRRAEICTLIPSVETSLAEKLRAAEDQVDSLHSSKLYHERILERMLQELHEVSPKHNGVHHLSASHKRTSSDGGERLQGNDALRSEGLGTEAFAASVDASYQAQLIQMQRAMQQLKEELHEKDSVIHSLRNMVEHPERG